MQKITSSAGLKDAIRQLEYENVIKRQLLNEQLSLVLERLKPAYLLRSYLSDIASTPYLVTNFFKTGIAQISGHLTDKLISVSSRNRVTRIIGPVIKFGMSILSSRSTDLLQLLWKRIMNRRVNQTPDQLNMIL
jgi:Glu-tRNA(Gln) amidotransferase subunit E-like FAD-binding protein